MVPEAGSGPIHVASATSVPRLLPGEHCTWRRALLFTWSGHSSAPQGTHEPSMQEASLFCPGSNRELPGQAGPLGSPGPAGGTGCPSWLSATCLHWPSLTPFPSSLRLPLCPPSSPEPSWMGQPRYTPGQGARCLNFLVQSRSCRLTM